MMRSTHVGPPAAHGLSRAMSGTPPLNRHHDLPVPLTPLVGREREVRDRRGGLAASGGRPPPHADRSRWRGQDSPGAPVAAQVADAFPDGVASVGLGPRSPTPVSSPLPSPRRSASARPVTSRSKPGYGVPPRQAPAARAGQLRAGRRGRPARGRTPCRVPGRDGARHQPGPPPGLGRARVPGALLGLRAGRRRFPWPTPRPSPGRSASSRSGRRRSGRSSPSRTRTPRPWPRSADGWTGFHWPSSWPPPASRCCRRPRCCRGWSGACRC